MMSQDRVFERAQNGGPVLHYQPLLIMLRTRNSSAFWRNMPWRWASPSWMTKSWRWSRTRRAWRRLRLESGRRETADLYLDASGFASVLLGKALGEPFVSYDKTLFCDRAVVGGWDRKDPEDMVIKPYTTCETMNCGWCWQIEHENRINRGYVYSSGFISDEEAEKEFRMKNPKVGPTRIVRFVSGRYRNVWVKNVVAVGNAGGFVEPLEATALGAMASNA